MLRPYDIEKLELKLGNRDTVELTRDEFYELLKAWEEVNDLREQIEDFEDKMSKDE